MTSQLSSYRPPVRGITHMVSAGHYLAASAGYRILEQGGNAVDAGVASGIAINVTLPNATNFGGVAPIMVYMSDTSERPRHHPIHYFLQYRASNHKLCTSG